MPSRDWGVSREPILHIELLAPGIVNPTCTDVFEVEIEPIRLVDRETKERCPSKDLFAATLRRAATSVVTELDWVHIPRNLQPVFAENNVSTIYSEVLDNNRLASRLLPGEPTNIILGVTTKSGEHMTAIPRVLRIARGVLLGSGILLCLGALALLTLQVGGTWATVGLAMGALCIREAADIPHKAYFF